MDFSLNEDQQLLMSSLESLLDKYSDVSHDLASYVSYSEALQEELIGSGFLDIANQDGFGVLEAAMLVEAVSACPYSVEVANSALIAPLIDEVDSPLAVAWSSGSPIRYLSKAKSVLLFSNGGYEYGSVSTDLIENIDSVIAYPLGKLVEKPANFAQVSLELNQQIYTRGLIGLAAEAAGLMRGALECTVNYVKQRQQFGQPLGNFQGIQHRLAECIQSVRACKSLAFRAAYTGDSEQALVASLYAQDMMRHVIHYCHQFSGAMGLTLEYPLHCWTYRLKYLQGEMGGRGAQAKSLAKSLWQGSGAA